MFLQFSNVRKLQQHWGGGNVLAVFEHGAVGFRALGFMALEFRALGFRALGFRLEASIGREALIAFRALGFSRV